MSAPFPWLAAPWERLSAARRHGRLGHALLLHGRAGFGKRRFATDFGRLMLCEATGNPEVACGACRACLLLEAGSHPDFARVAPLEEGKALVIDQVRELGDYFALRPHYGTAKIAILEAADSMNRPAANALLKLLEEPPLGALIMLVADRPSQLLPTIRSRCQQFALDQGDPASILEWLCAQDGAGDARREVENLARAAGSPLAARALAEQGLATAIDGLVAGMGNIAIGKLQPLAAAAQFAPLPLTLLVDQMLRVCHELLLLKCGAALPLASLGREPEAGLLRLADALHSHGVGAFMQKALEVKRLKLGPVTLRELDLAESLWFDWQSLCTVDKRRAAAR